MQNYVGQQIDRYRIVERLGMGGMAVVYKAYDTRLERDVALKLIRIDEIPPSQYDRLMKRFEREAKAQAKFSHPNIVPVYDYGEVDGSPYLVMGYVSGDSMKKRLDSAIPFDQAIEWLLPIADALSYAHRRGVIHRDVKPSNILFDDEGRSLLTDFGIAKILETDEATLTGTGMGVGTPEYMAPEQWQGQTSEATDQYALGVVLYELITGKKPYQADTPAAVAILQATEPLAPPSKLVRGVPETVEKVLYKTLARNPEDRYEDMEAFQKALSLINKKVKQVTNEIAIPIKKPINIPSKEISNESNNQNVIVKTKNEDKRTKTQNKGFLKLKITKGVFLLGLGVILIIIFMFLYKMGLNSVIQNGFGKRSQVMMLIDTENVNENTTTRGTATFQKVSTDELNEIMNVQSETETHNNVTKSSATSIIITLTHDINHNLIKGKIDSNNAILRGGPDVKHSYESDRLEKGEDIKIISKTEDSLWFFVELLETGERGWLYEAWIIISDQIEDIPIETLIPTYPPRPEFTNTPKPSKPSSNPQPLYP